MLQILYKSVAEAKSSYDDALKDARTLFGDDKDSEPLVRTSAIQVFTKKYASVKEAKSSYDDTLKDARTLFGDDKDSESLVRTAALHVFTKLYKSVAEAKSSYDEFKKAAYHICVNDKKLSEIDAIKYAIVIARRVFAGNFKDIASAIQSIFK